MPAPRAAKKPRKTTGRKAAGRRSASSEAKVVTKWFRIGSERARIVERIAKKENKTESEVLRGGIIFCNECGHARNTYRRSGAT